MELFDIGPWVAFTALAISAVILIAAVVYFIHSAPPTTISISSGPASTASDKLVSLGSISYQPLLVFVPVLVIMIPTLRSIPAFFRWMA